MKIIVINNNSNSKFRSRIENFINYDSNIKQFFDEKIHPFVNKITQCENNLLKEKMNWKISGGKGFKAHQDQPAWTDFPPEKYFSVAIFANNSTKDNGCLQFGFNKECVKYDSLLKYNKEGLGELCKSIEDKLNWVYYESTPKDILIFDSYIPHRSFENITNSSRRIFYFTFHESKYGNFYDDYIKKKRELFPPDIERDSDNIQLYNNKYNLANPIN